MKDKEILKKVFGLLKPYKSRIGIIMISCLLTSVLFFFFPMLIKNITDVGLLEKNMQVVIFFSVLLIALALFEQVITLIQTYLFTDLQNKVQYSLFHRAFHKLLHLKINYFEDKNDAEIINCMVMDVNNVSSIADTSVMMLASYILRIFSGLVGLLMISWKLTIVIAVVIPVKFFITRYLAERRKRMIEEMIELNRDFYGWFGDNVDGMREIKLWNLYQKQQGIFEKKQKNVLKNNRKNRMLDAWDMAFENVLERVVSASLYIFGGFLLCMGQLSLGEIFAFVSYSYYVTGPLSAIMAMNFVFSNIVPSAERLFSFMEMEEEPENGNEKSMKLETALEFSDVSFSYDERELLKGINFEIKKGEKVAVIGENGSGKSTIINLLLQFNEPNQGEIRQDGQNIQKINLHAYRSQFAVVSQDPYLFQESVLKNIDLNENGDNAELERACRQSGAWSFIERLPEKLNSKIGQNGARLSGGERQKLAVARALIKDAPIVILDEATSNFDVGSDAYLHKILVEDLKDKTVLLITHKYENIKDVDRVFKLQAGAVQAVK